MANKKFDQYKTEELESKLKTTSAIIYALYVLIVIFGLIMVAMMLKGLPPLSLIPFAISALLINRLMHLLGNRKLGMVEELTNRRQA